MEPSHETTGQALTRQYAQWLEQFDAPRTRRWARRALGRDDSAATAFRAEALVWRALRSCGHEISPGEHAVHGGADFHCRGASDGECMTFRVEVTTLAEQTVARALRREGRAGLPFMRRYAALTPIIKRKVCRKRRQAADDPEPWVIFVVLPDETVEQAAPESVVTELLARPVGAGETQRSHGIVAGFDLSFSIVADPRGEPLRRNVSAVIVGGRTDEQVVWRGVLHPAPHRPVPAALLPFALLARLDPWPITTRSAISWIRGSQAG